MRAKKRWNPAKQPIPEYPKLIVDYDPDVDILTLWNGTPASNGSTVAGNLMVFFTDEEPDEPQMVVLENASQYLLPLLERITQTMDMERVARDEGRGLPHRHGDG